MKNCPKCGAPVDDNAICCTTCGASLIPQMNNSGTQMSNSGTQEKILYTSYSTLNKIIGIILLILAIAGIITGFILLFPIGWYEVVPSIFPAVIFGVLGIILFQTDGEKLVITDRRVYVVNKKMVKRINIPVDSITVWGAGSINIFVGNSAGRAGRIMAFANKKDRNAISSILENLLIERQNSTSSESSNVH